MRCGRRAPWGRARRPRSAHAGSGVGRLGETLADRRGRVQLLRTAVTCSTSFRNDKGGPGGGSDTAPLRAAPENRR
ncbi:hypothetical protein SHJG_7174 [Streptomyces hygroscopicus subsp. jinggangensis 5008]|nr:hypothetical protein SHJG_7174 [Streptomyces hygroscopicus subsp. jinggangensis 5008]AGF66596.1 hypothetical protein SHJGH_6934 [Streptomyces hygroscopicus subsp. jinggangensis TL01]